MTFSLFLAKRFIRHPGGGRRSSGMASIIGVALGVMLLLVVLAVLNGLADDLKTRILGTESHVRITSTTGTALDLSPELDSLLSEIPGILASARFVQGELLIMYRGRTAGALLYGIDFGSSTRRIELERMIGSTGLPGEREQGSLILGSLLAQKLWAAPGDTVLLATPKELMPKPGGRPPRLISRMVSSVFSSGLPEYDASLVFLPVEEASRLLKGQSVVGIELWLDNPDRAPGIEDHILAAVVGGGDSLRVQSWGDLNRNLFNALRLEKIAMFAVLVLVILIAALNITGSILRNVMLRRGEIAILLTMGCVPKTVLAVFLLEGILTGILGAGLGCAVGFLVCKGIVATGILAVPGDFLPFPSLPLVMSPTDFLWVSLAAVFITTASAVYPAFRASKTDPVAILRDL